MLHIIAHWLKKRRILLCQMPANRSSLGASFVIKLINVMPGEGGGFVCFVCLALATKFIHRLLICPSVPLTSHKDEILSQLPVVTRVSLTPPFPCHPTLLNVIPEWRPPRRKIGRKTGLSLSARSPQDAASWPRTCTGRRIRTSEGSATNKWPGFCYPCNCPCFARPLWKEANNISFRKNKKMIKSPKKEYFV